MNARRLITLTEPCTASSCGLYRLILLLVLPQAVDSTASSCCLYCLKLWFVPLHLVACTARVMCCTAPVVLLVLRAQVHSLLQHLWLPPGLWEDEACLVHPRLHQPNYNRSWIKTYAATLEERFLAVSKQSNQTLKVWLHLW